MECMLCGRGRKEVPRYADADDWMGASNSAKEEDVDKRPPTRAPIGIDAMNSTAASMGEALKNVANYHSIARKKAEAEAGDSSESDWED